MAIAGLVFQKLIVLFLLMLMGLFLAQRQILTKEVTFQLSNLLTRFVAPSLFISSFIYQDFSLKRLVLLISMIGSAFLLLVTRIFFVSFLLPKERATDQYAVLFANVGFMGTPLAFAVGGKEAVFFISGFVVANQIMQWTYGLYLIAQDKSIINWRSILVNPAMIATVIGLALFIIPFKLPVVFRGAIDSFADLNTPLSTIVLGSYFYKADIKEIFLYKPAYYTAFLRLCLTALLSILTIWILPIDSSSVKLALSIAAVSPAALNTALLSQVYGGNYEYGSRLVLLTTILSLIFIPLNMALASLLYLS
ncbi:AEC family transporter [Streptococcus macacae]|uniref:Transporter, auxin efflux carrier domain protein n=1 Tax=Streptococcus macacae NCTC 11558 TaxID=764298 RepID=G5JU19_9STRE|nr:AEC family transporter [Streptococcus macacae]EHJ51626.1 transporter, auxin efflux carrier domain protein [Streptococcus macacae NCTC 11558]SUN78386.1 permease [Streptococcus macacae NCTC 11558]